MLTWCSLKTSTVFPSSRYTWIKRAAILFYVRLPTAFAFACNSNRGCELDEIRHSPWGQCDTGLVRPRYKLLNTIKKSDHANNVLTFEKGANQSTCLHELLNNYKPKHKQIRKQKTKWFYVFWTDSPGCRWHALHHQRQSPSPLRHNASISCKVRPRWSSLKNCPSKCIAFERKVFGFLHRSHT